MSLVPLSQAGATPLALRSCVPPVVANERLLFILPSLSLSVTLSSLFCMDRTGPGRSSRMPWQEAQPRWVGSLVYRFLVALFFRFGGPGGRGFGTSKRRRLNGGFSFVHKRSVADAISVDRDEGRLPR